MVPKLWPRLSTFIANRPRAALFRGLGLVLLLLTIIFTILGVEESVSHVKTAPASDYAVIKSNFADPCLLSVEGMFYAFATRPNASLNVQVASAKNIADWTLHEGYDAMPTRPSWTLQEGDAAVWAPQVVQRVSLDLPGHTDVSAVGLSKALPVSRDALLLRSKPAWSLLC